MTAVVYSLVCHSSSHLLYMNLPYRHSSSQLLKPVPHTQDVLWLHGSGCFLGGGGLCGLVGMECYVHICLSCYSIALRFRTCALPALHFSPRHMCYCGKEKVSLSLWGHPSAPVIHWTLNLQTIHFRGRLLPGQEHKRGYLLCCSFCWHILSLVWIKHILK